MRPDETHLWIQEKKGAKRAHKEYRKGKRVSQESESASR